MLNNNLTLSHMRIFTLVSLIILFSSTLGFSQDTNASGARKNGIYAEGYLIRHDFSEGFFSINYERNIGKKAKTYLRVGLYPDFESTVSLPFTISRITSPVGKHHFEYGIGFVYRIEHFVDPLGINTREWFYDIPAIMIPLMYRYQSDSPWYFRGGINVFVSWPVLPSPSVSAGYRF